MQPVPPSEKPNNSIATATGQPKASAPNRGLELVVIGPGGDGTLPMKLAGRIADSDPSVQQFFARAVFIDSSIDAIKQLQYSLGRNFYWVTKEEMQRVSGLGAVKEVRADEKLPLHYELVCADFPRDKESRQHMGDAVLLNYMLPYHGYDKWGAIIEAAYEQVNSGGVLILPFHELNYHRDISRSIGHFLSWIGGRTLDIDAAADGIMALPGLKNANFSFHLIDGGALWPTRHAAKRIVEFLSLDIPSNLALIKQNPDKLGSFVEAQRVVHEIDGKRTVLYELLVDNKVIVARKPQNY